MANASIWWFRNSKWRSRTVRKGQRIEILAKILEENLWPEIRARIKRRCVSSVKWILAIVSWPIRRSSDFGFQSEEVLPSEMVNASRYWRKISEENLWPEIRALIKRRCVTSVTWIFAMGSWPMRRSGDFGFQRGNSLHSKAFLLPLLLSRSKDHGKEKTRPGRLSPPCCNLLFVVGFCRDFFRCLHAQRTFLAQNANPWTSEDYPDLTTPWQRLRHSG